MAAQTFMSPKVLALGLLLLAAGVEGITFPKRLNKAAPIVEAPKEPAAAVQAKEPSKKEPIVEAPKEPVAAVQADATVAEAPKEPVAAVQAEAPKSSPTSGAERPAAAAARAALEAKTEEDLEEEDLQPATSLLQESLQLERNQPATMVCDERGCKTVPAEDRHRPKHDEF